MKAFELLNLLPEIILPAEWHIYSTDLVQAMASEAKPLSLFSVNYCPKVGKEHSTMRSGY
jgi:hypothetical protein